MDKLLQILQIPDRCLVNKKITKAFFKRNFELTISERALLDDFSIISGIDWLATVSPANANINGLQEEGSMYEEIQLIIVQTNEADFDRNKFKIAELVQKYIPYHTLLCVYHHTTFILNTCDKKVNQNDSSRRTIDKRYFSENISLENPNPQQSAFLQSLAFAGLDKTNLKTYYDAYSQRIIALQAAELSGVFSVRTSSRSQSDMASLEQIETINKEISLLQVQAAKESQLNQRIRLNVRIKQLEHQIDLLIASLE
jgi:hypothetical protein